MSRTHRIESKDRVWGDGHLSHRALVSRALVFGQASSGAKARDDHVLAALELLFQIVFLFPWERKFVRHQRIIACHVVNKMGEDGGQIQTNMVELGLPQRMCVLLIVDRNKSE